MGKITMKTETFTRDWNAKRCIWPARMQTFVEP